MDILYLTIKDLLYLSNSYDMLEYRILYRIWYVIKINFTEHFK